MYATRHQFREDLKELERETLGAIDLVVGQFDRALASVSNHDIELAEAVIVASNGIDGRYLEVHRGLVLLLACEAPVAGDLRIVAALLQIVRCIERIGAQCANIAKLVPLSGDQAPRDKQLLLAIERMGQLARHELTQAKEAFITRDGALAQDLVAKDAGIARLNRELFNRAVEIGEDIDVREWAMFMILVARALERIADNAVAIAEQTVFVVTGFFRESTDPSQIP
jgi:phosphate transport system protein